MGGSERMKADVRDDEIRMSLNDCVYCMTIEEAIELYTEVGLAVTRAIENRRRA
jgi:hypothetical protein